MNCSNDLCLHNKGYICTLDEVNINTLGMCDDCTMIRLDKSFLEAEKERQLQEIESKN